MRPVLDNFENVPLVHEAKAWEHYCNGMWRKALNESWKWFYDQPFSDRPVILGSYIATTVLGDYKESIKILEKGKVSNPNEFLVLNNLAFSYASIDEVSKAQNVFNEINTNGLDDRDKIVLDATEGLIAFRSGEIEKGRAKYLKAIKAAEIDKILQARAYVYYAREEVRAKTQLADSVKKTALEKSEEIKNTEIQIITKRELKQKVESDK